VNQLNKAIKSGEKWLKGDKSAMNFILRLSVAGW